MTLGVRLLRVAPLLLLCGLFIGLGTRRLLGNDALAEDPAWSGAATASAAAESLLGAPAAVAAARGASTAAAPRPSVVVVDFQLPAQGVYRANDPWEIAAHCFGGGLEQRNWTAALAHGRGLHAVIRLPNSDFAGDLRPLSRFLVGLCLLLAAEEAGVGPERFEQLHFVAPAASPTLMRGPSGLRFDGAGDWMGVSTANATSRSAPPPAATASVARAAATPALAKGTTAMAAAEMPGAVDADGVKHWRWTVHLREQGPADLFARPWVGPVDGVLERSLKKKKQPNAASAGLAVNGGGKGGLKAPLLSAAGGAQALVTRVADAGLHELGSFGRHPSPWVESFGLTEARRAERLQALARRLCNATATTATTTPAGQQNGGFKVVLYQRDATRRLRRADEAAAALRARLPVGSEVTVVLHSEARPACELVALLAEADALVTPHGFSAVLAWFLPPGALLAEINPYRYAGFEPHARLASAFGVGHVGVASEPVRKLQPALLDMIAPLFLPGHDPRRCQEFSLCRFLARQFPVRLDAGPQLDALAARIREAGAERRRQREAAGGARGREDE